MEEPPYFDLDVVTFEAKHVVVARVWPASATAEVIESWRGDLAPGTKLSIPGVAPVDSRTRRTLVAQNQPLRRVIGTDRLVLFLGAKAGDVYPLARPVGLSFLAVEGGHVYAPALPFSYWGMGDFQLDETQLHAQVALLGAARDELAAAQKLPKGTSASALARLLSTSPSHTVRWRAHAALRACGAEAAPALRRLAHRSLDSNATMQALAALAECSTKDYVEELRGFLADEARFWKRVAPSLHDQWWNGAGFSGAEETRWVQGHSELARVLYAWARNLDDAKVKEEARALAKVWKRTASLKPLAANMGMANEIP